jgi:HAD superfamily hydrolase (TIGR01509 family)
VSAILFGSLSTIADTSELQRVSFNQAFEACGLEWRWDRDDYLAMLEDSGGRERVSTYAASLGQTVDAEVIHRKKSDCFQQLLAEGDLQARPGVIETLQTAKRNGVKVAWVTTTSSENISALLTALRPAVERSDFDIILDSSSVEFPKPDRAAYDFAMRSLGEARDRCIAIEDNVDGVRAARAAGLTCVAFPNENTADHHFETAQARVSELKFQELNELIPLATI